MFFHPHDDDDDDDECSVVGSHSRREGECFSTRATQHIPHSPLSFKQVLAEYDNDIRNYFRRTAPPPSPEGGASPAMGEMGVGAEVMDNYVKSCAGFCVISFILGLGDR